MLRDAAVSGKKIERAKEGAVEAVDPVVDRWLVRVDDEIDD